MISLVTQKPGTNTCGQCVVAMLTGQHFADVQAFMGTGRNYQRDMRKAFRHFGYTMANHSIDAGQQTPASAVFVEVQHEGQKFQHWVAWDGTRILDPRGVSPAGELVSAKFYPVHRNGSVRL